MEERGDNMKKEASHPTGHNCPDDMKYNDKAGKCEIQKQNTKLL